MWSANLDDAEIVRTYVRCSMPMQWVCWWSDLELGMAKTHLGQILWKDDRLVSLTEPKVREAVLDCAMQHEVLFRMILEDFLTSHP